MNFKTVGIIFRKELIDVLRDRRTLIFMVALPTLLVPLLMAGVTRFMRSQMLKTQSMQLVLQTSDDERARWIGFLQARLQPYDSLFEMALQVLGKEVAEPVHAIAKDLGMTTLGVFTGLHADPRVVAHPRCEELRRVLAGAQRKAEREVRNARSSDEESGTGPAKPHVLAGIEGVDVNSAQAQQLMTLLELMSPLVSLRYVTPSESAQLPPQREPVPLESLPEDVRSDDELCAAALAVTSERIQGLLRVPEELDERLLDGTHGVEVELLYDSTIPRSDEAHRRVTAAIERAGAMVLRDRLARKALPTTFAEPLTLVARNAAPPAKEKLKIVAGFLPYILILMCFLGGLYPAIDLGAAEKERLTLETLLVTPVQRVEIAAGKFLVIFLAALVAALLATSSLAYTFQSGLAAPEMRTMLDIQIAPLTIALSILLILPVAAVFASLLLAISIYARSYKEAQSYMMPLQFAVIIPAMLSLTPNLQLDAKVAWIPILNVALALRELLTASGAPPPWAHLGVILLSSSVLAAASLLYCAKRFEREEVLFRS